MGYFNTQGQSGKVEKTEWDEKATCQALKMKTMVRQMDAEY